MVIAFFWLLMPWYKYNVINVLYSRPSTRCERPARPRKQRFGDPAANRDWRPERWTIPKISLSKHPHYQLRERQTVAETTGTRTAPEYTYRIWRSLSKMEFRNVPSLWTRISVLVAPWVEMRKKFARSHYGFENTPQANKKWFWVVLKMWALWFLRVLKVFPRDGVSPLNSVEFGILNGYDIQFSD